ncbi:MAG TPA: carboxypeptidase-like regulatory domain-containing protein [Gemmataceae bacterium]|nr:carboxypeptidase-like regulatory domain-containing protein [Gemmataceae bacterium]
MTKKILHGRCFWACTLLGLHFSLFLLAGCSGSSKTATVTGKVTYKGEPVTGGTIILTPAEDSDAGKYQILINSDGTFSVSGVPPGPKKVSIETESVKKLAAGGYNMKMPPGGKKPDGGEVKKPEFDTSNQPKYVQIPKKYADPSTSGLTWEITTGKQEPKTFDLTD